VPLPYVIAAPRLRAHTTDGPDFNHPALDRADQGGRVSDTPIPYPMPNSKEEESCVSTSWVRERRGVAMTGSGNSDAPCGKCVASLSRRSQPSAIAASVPFYGVRELAPHVGLPAQRKEWVKIRAMPNEASGAILRGHVPQTVSSRFTGILWYISDTNLFHS
jgi:hypothetical protein